MKPSKNLIDSLATDLQPVKQPPNLNGAALVWLAISLAYVVVVTLLTGPLRPDVFAQLQSAPRFAFEMALGLAALSAMGFVLVKSALPGALGNGLRIVSIALVAIWLASLVFGLVSPALEPSMAGKRPHCVFETFIFALPPMAAALLWQRRYYPLSVRNSALYAGLAAGLLPAWMMQIACMYDPVHILSFHVAPGLAVAMVALLIVSVVPFFKRQSPAETV